MSIWTRIRAWFATEPREFISAPVVDEVAELGEQLRQVRRLGDLHSPSSLCICPGVYGLVRGGELVDRPDGMIQHARMEVGVRFPPGLTKGDRWQRLDPDHPALEGL